MHTYETTADSLSPANSQFTCANDSNQTPARAHAASHTMMHQGLRVFLVEDSSMLRERLTDTLAASNNVEIIGHAETEAMAVARLASLDWDVLILDLQLLHGTGLGVLRGLSGHRNPGTKVIVLTNYSIPSYRSHSMRLGADFFFDKMQEFGRVVEVLNDIAAGKHVGGQSTGSAAAD